MFALLMTKAGGEREAEREQKKREEIGFRKGPKKGKKETWLRKEKTSEARGFFSLSFLSLSLYPIPHNTNPRTQTRYIQKMASTMASTSSAFTVAPHRSSKTKRNLFSVRAMAGKAFEVPKKYTKVQPMGGRVLIKIAETEVQTKGGVLLTQGSQQKPTSGAFGDDFVSSSSFERERFWLVAAPPSWIFFFSPYRLSFEKRNLFLFQKCNKRASGC